MRIGKRPYPAKPESVKQCYHTQLSAKQSRETPWFKYYQVDITETKINTNETLTQYMVIVS